MSGPLTSAVTQGASLGRVEALYWAAEQVLRGHSVPMPAAREAPAEELDTLIQTLRADRETRVQELVGVGSRRPTLEASILAILARSSTFSGRTGFNDPVAIAPLQEHLARIIARDLPLLFAIPLGGGKSAHPLKVGNVFLPELSEWVAMNQLGAIAEAVSRLYRPGARVVTIPDAGLHTHDLGFSAAEIAQHRYALLDDLARLGLQESVVVADTIAHLPPEWPGRVLEHALERRERQAKDEAVAADLANQANALVYILNQRMFAWSYERSVLVNLAIADPKAEVPEDVLQDADGLRRQADRVVAHYAGVNHALRSLDIPGRIARELFDLDDYVRLTVHAKPGEPRPLLAPSNRLARPALIPMHSIGLRFRSDGEPRTANVFDIEARRHGYRPVVDSVSGRFVYLEAQEEATESERH